MSLTLYHVDWCPDCDIVRQKLAELGLDYEDILVSDIRSRRKQVHEVSGQYYVPVIKDNELVLTETADILAYLDQQYGPNGGDATSSAQVRPQARSTPDEPGEDDEHPSCRIN